MVINNGTFKEVSSKIYTMSLPMIYDRIDELLEIIKKNPEDQDLYFNSEMELSYLEALREEIE
ncbi:hypothetical protein GCM10007103_12670 [Salinimicrobium marinum]|uniref:Uncharacterized protein n=1 Tax=Salinimicrobium marinum TaxID=680283 RepID=A0A918VWX9_9FLAO|nr:hypothetical protein GCM10007103_12670 [Salinimicrobium marinum]